MTGIGSVFAEVMLLLTFTVLACRWVFGAQGVRRVVPRPDYGMLTPVLRTDTRLTADAASAQLADAGLRATVAAAGKGFTATGRPWPSTAHVVLVFPEDRDTAQHLLRSSRTG